ncbi:low-specificity L-threonine aldolase [Lacrimispora sp. NSJ-141]|uniref:Low-specificity L-threonine aldolase n=1 Tax=Lientehia hominis TaxID=2897778 RepID=A0AAP2RIB3_9FIRM|nr:low-specificity L-threonine aldolase [Lientehia hominis]MCD2491974.1 low-specificity L-threonine aldolase [Lientehia hominis]
MKVIDVRSDTVTVPTDEMRKAMAECPVGDDVYGDDPTVNELERTAAEILGKEAALFFPSGTQCNQAAIMSWTNRGNEIIVSDMAHIYEHEVGAAAVLSGANMRTLHFKDGIPDCGQIERAIRREDIHCPETALICLENALANGRVVPVENMRQIYEMAGRHGIPVHMDGARCFNAAVAQEVDVKEITQYVDSVSCCLSKGLCAPVGSVLAGKKEFIAKARKNRKLLGGGMRQAGVLAAPGLIAVREMPRRLHIDHENARYLAEGLSKIPGIDCEKDAVQINMVFFRIDREEEIRKGLPMWLLQRGIKTNPEDGGLFRMVTNAGVERKDMDVILKALTEYLA